MPARGSASSPRRHDHSAAAARLRAAAAWLVPATTFVLSLASVARAEQPAGRIVAVHTLPAVPLSGAGGRTTTLLGGISDLAPTPTTAGSAAEGRPHADRPGRLGLWAITDRGPNGTLDTSSGKRRTLLDRSFVPSIIALEIDSAARDTAAAGVSTILPLADRAGEPLSGRPNGVGRDEPILDPADASTIPPDPDGIDCEGLVRMRDGTFWVAEEYRPSLLEVTSDGRAVARFVPMGQSIPGASMAVHEVLPAAYGSRKDNRGFEAIAVSPDQSRLWLLLQSPLEHPVPKAAKATGNVRLLAFDVASRKPVAEYLYRLGDPTAAGYLDRGAAPEDGKLCAIAAIDAGSLLVLEQADGGLARLYACSLQSATNTLGRQEGSSADQPALEQIADLRAAGIAPVGKRLIADLAECLPRMADDVYRKHPQDAPPLKLEGIALLDARHVVIVNDNDFGVHGSSPGKDPSQTGTADDARPATPRTCLWVVELPTALWPEAAGRAIATP